MESSASTATGSNAPAVRQLALRKRLRVGRSGMNPQDKRLKPQIVSEGTHDLRPRTQFDPSSPAMSSSSTGHVSQRPSKADIQVDAGPPRAWAKVLSRTT